ncbi:MAG: two-component regulator propeller domain-containing protein, partial [Bacteroidota bacterium]
TDNGLSRFDGKEFFNLSVKDGLLGSSVLGLAELPDQTLIAGIYKKGINRIQGEHIQALDSNIDAYPFFPEIFSENDTLISSGNGNIFILSKHKRIRLLGEALYEKAGIGLMSKKNNGKIVPTFYYSNQLKLNDGEYVFGSKYGLIRWNFPFEAEPFCQNAIDRLKSHELYLDSKGNIWIGSSGVIYVVNQCEIIKTIEKGISPGKKVHRILEDKNGEIWLSIKNQGLCRWDSKNNEVVQIGEQFGIPQTEVNYLYLDREGNIWVATYGDGVVQIIPTQFEKFKDFSLQCSEYISALEKDDSGFLYIGSNTGLGYIYQDIFRPFPSLNCKQDSYIHDLNYYPKNGLFISSYVSLDTQVLHQQDWHIPILSAKARSGIISKNDVLVTSDQDFRLQEFGTFLSGIDLSTYQNRFELAKQAQLQFQIKLNSLDSPRVLKEDASGNIWIGENVGISFIEFKKGKAYFRRFSYPLQQFDLPNQVATNDIIWGPLGKVWFATEMGLGVYEEGSWNWFTEREGLIHRHCTSLTFDDKGFLWIGTQDGLCRYDGQEFLRFGKAEGLDSEEINCLLIDKGEDKLWVGTAKGLFYARLKKLQEVKRSDDIPLHIAKISSSKRDFVFPAELSLESDERDISINFSGIEYSAPQSVATAYKMLGYDQEWSDTKLGRVSYRNLSDGAYIFQVKAKRKGSNSWTSFSEVPISIAPPLYKHPIFYILFSAFFMAVIGLLAFYRVRSIKLREREKRELSAKFFHLEQQALDASLNKHFIFNALSSIQYHLNRHETREANDYLGIFARLIRMNLNLAPKQQVALTDELERIELYLQLENMRFDDVLTYEIMYNELARPHEVLIPSMILQPYVENAIWHGILPKKTNGHIEISIEGEEASLLINIKDDGIGIEESKKLNRKKKHISRGMEISRERLQLMETKTPNSPNTIHIQECKAESGEAIGTLVSLRIPLVRSQML